jgi:hypothetical protein
VTDPRLPGGLTCDEVRDLAGSFVLDALPDAEAAAVRGHLASCPEPHPEIAELAGVVPVLHASIRPMDPPPALKDRIMAAAAADLDARLREAASTAPAAGDGIDLGRPRPGPRTEPLRLPDVRQPRLSWALGLAAVLAIVLLGGWNLGLQAELDSARAYQAKVASVVEAAGQPGALAVVMRGASGDGPTGIAAVSASGDMRIAMRDLAPTTGDEVYEAWVIEPDTAPVALGDFRVATDGVGYLEASGLPAEPGIVLALTREPRPGMTAPSTDPVSLGTATATG